MRVCVFGTRGFPNVEGGVEKHCEELYPLLGKEMEIIVFRRKSYVVNKAEYKNIRFVDLPSTRIKGVEALIHSCLAAISTIWIHPDAVHIHNIGPALFAPLLKLFSIPVVLTYHSPNYEHKKWGYFAKKLLRFCELIALKFADKVVFVNRFQMQKFGQPVQNKSIYIPNGITEPNINKNQSYLEKIGVQPGKYILSVGRITPEKGFHTLIKAFGMQKEADYKLVVAGGVEFENSYMQELAVLSENLPVVFTGYVSGDDLAQLYSNAALYVLASENEGFPLVLLEAMSYKRNVLVSDIPATHLVSLKDTDYFSMGDAATLAKMIEEKLLEPSERVYDLKGFTWENHANQIAEIFREVCSG